MSKMISGFLEWIKKIEKENPPTPEIVAINFGVFESDKGFMVYVTGSEIYDPNDDDWAGEIDYQPSRANKYFSLPIEITKGQKWQAVLKIIIEAVEELIDTNPSLLLFYNRTVTAGFDDGELTVIKN